MGFRVDKIAVQMDVYVEFELRQTIKFEYMPTPDDPLAASLLAKNTELNKAAMDAEIAAGKPTDEFFG